MENEAIRQMFLQTTVALLSLGLAVVTIMFMGPWV